MGAANIAARAIAQLGTPFRFRGRTPGVGLDCVGLALSTLDLPADAEPQRIRYAMRGNYQSIVERLFAQLPFRRLEEHEMESDGDILLVCAGPSQLHLMIAVQGGWVHAHAGLQQVVFTPTWPNWPIIHRWRLIGD